MKSYQNFLLLGAAFASSPVALADGFTRQQATGSCMLSIKQMLHDPDSATFGHSQDASVSIKGNRAVVIRSVRAKNGFGAVRLSEFICLLESKGDTINAVLVSPKGQNSEKIAAILKKWGMP